MKKYILFVCICLCGITDFAYSQRVPQEPLTDRFPSRWAIKINPFTILDPVDPTLQVAVEYMIKPNLGIQQEMGFLRVRNWLTDGDKYPRNIFRMRTELRHYFSSHRKAPYIAVEGLYKHINQKEDVYVDKGNYWEEVSYKQVRNVAALHFKIGWQLPISRDERWLVDVYTGIGIRRIWVHTTNRENVPPEFIRDSFWLAIPPSGNGDYTYPGMILGFKMGCWLGSLKTK